MLPAIPGSNWCACPSVATGTSVERCSVSTLALRGCAAWISISSATWMPISPSARTSSNTCWRNFAADSRLGVAGTPFVEENASYDFRFTAVDHVSGACQLFRHECYEGIGGYVQVKGGGIDWIAVTTARMQGWRTRTFVDRVCHHHRPMGTASVGEFRASLRLGRQDYYLGSHPLWQVFRACYQMARKPYLVGGLALFAGYFWAWIRGVRRPISRELIQFHQREQMRRLLRGISRAFRIGPSPGDSTSITAPRG